MRNRIFGVLAIIGAALWPLLWEFVRSRGSGAPLKENHNKQFSSSAPLKCEITFYGDKPIFNVEVHLTVEFHESIRSENRVTSGKIFKTIDTVFSIKQVSFPDKNVFKFYVYSFDFDACLGITIPTIFSFSTDDSSRAFSLLAESHGDSSGATFMIPFRR